MKAILLICALFFVGCNVTVQLGETPKAHSTAGNKEFPTVNLPKHLRESNWLGKQRYWDKEERAWMNEGSCVHATMISLMRWQGRYAMANHWRRTYDSGEVADAEWNPNSNLAAKFEKEGVRYAYTTAGDVTFLEWACSTRRGCGVTVMAGRHMVALVHFDDEWAGILDPNDTDTILWVERETFVTEWQNSNGWAVAVVYTPAPPL